MRLALVVAGVPAALFAVAISFERPLTGMVADQVTNGMLCRPIADLRAVMVELSERRGRGEDVKLDPADVERALGQGDAVSAGEPARGGAANGRNVRWTINIGDQRYSTIKDYSDKEYTRDVNMVLRRSNGDKWLYDVASDQGMLKACSRVYVLDSEQLKSYRRGIYTVSWSKYYYDRVRVGVSQSIADAHLLVYYVVLPAAMMWVVATIIFIWFSHNIGGLAAEIRGVASGRSMRLVGVYPREFSPLQGAFNLGMEANEKAMAGMRQLIRKLAHDLNNGLAGLLGVAELAESDPARPVDPVTVRGIAAEMRSLVERYRSLAESSDMEGAANRRDVFDLIGFMQQRIAGQELALQNRDVRYNLTVADEAVGPETPPLEVLLYKTDLSVAVTNLLSNASKYGRGRVYVDVALVGAEVVIQVEDNGEGIPPDKRKYIFEESARLEVDHDKPGSGFGLGIVRLMCALMGGSVTVRDSDYGGACFELRLPAGPAADGGRRASTSSR